MEKRLKFVKIIDMNNYRQQIGAKGEDLAEGFLIKKGYTIIEKNYRCKDGEIDIITKDEFGDFVFIEVKSRTNNKYGNPQDAVDNEKLSKIEKTAANYLQSQFEWEDMSWRIDIVEVFIRDEKITINHVENVT